MVTATCETDIDWASQGYYEPSVVCQLTDGDGNVIASGQYFDDSDDVSAVVVLQIQGIAGTNYIATGRHLALISIPLDNPDPQTGEPEEYYLDEYNFSYLVTATIQPIRTRIRGTAPGRRPILPLMSC